VESHYFELEEAEERARLRETLLRSLERQENRLLAALENLEKRRSAYGEADDHRLCGELILNHLHTLERGQRWLEVEDYRNPGQSISIELDPQASPAENAESYFRRYRKAKASLRNLEQEQRHLQARLEALRRKLQKTADEQDLHRLREEVQASKRGKKRAGDEKDQPPGLLFHSGPFTLLVGRTAQENDALLRRWVKGNDTWLHARDYPGAYVFIRAIPGKSVPLHTLLDGANLAVLYSKARGSGRGDVYYTQVKYLRRAKGGKTGTVLPTQEKNLQVAVDPARIRRLRAENGFDDTAASDVL
jgi:predicted ribosome quality control (RQC) complex YloA/Tae2 family protein